MFLESTGCGKCEEWCYMKLLMGCATLGYKSRVAGSQMGASTTISVQMCLAFERALSPYLSASGFVVNLSPLSSPYRNHGNNQNLVLYAIDQPVSSTAKLDFVSVSQPSKSIGRNVRVDQTCSELSFELICNAESSFFHSLHAFSENSSS